MSILWCGGEDLDFPAATGNMTVNTDTRYFRSAYARCALKNSGIAKSNAFTPVTSGGWLTARLSCYYMLYSQPSASSFFLGLIDSSTAASGLWIGTSSDRYHMALFKFDGSTATELTTGPPGGIGFGYQDEATMYRLDIQVTSYSSNGTVNLYINGGGLAFSYTGDLTVNGVTNLDAVGICCNGNTKFGVSEMIVADEDTRAMVLMTGAPTAAGTTDQWTGAFGDISEATLNDTTAIYTNTAAQDEQFNITDPPAGVFKPRAIKIAARASSPTGSTATKVGLGVNNGGVIDAGTLQSPGLSWVTLERLMAQDPTKSADWDLADLAALQVNFRSGS